MYHNIYSLYLFIIIYVHFFAFIIVHVHLFAFFIIYVRDIHLAWLIFITLVYHTLCSCIFSCHNLCSLYHNFMFIYLDLSSSCIIIYLVDYPKQCVWGCRICEAEIQLVILRRGDTSLRQGTGLVVRLCVPWWTKPWRIILHSRGGVIPVELRNIRWFFLSFWERKSFQSCVTCPIMLWPSWTFMDLPCCTCDTTSDSSDTESPQSKPQEEGPDYVTPIILSWFGWLNQWNLLVP